ncbi:MAG: response regulator transcription factor [Acidimicrobiales bacterium]
MIRVLVVDDHAMVRAGLASLLGSTADIEVVACSADGAAGVRAAREQAPDVVLMDLSMPGVGGVQATAELLEDDPSVKVVILTANADQQAVHQALNAGAVGYLLKDSDPDDVVAAIHAAARGEAPLDPRAATALLPSRSSSPTAALTPREHEVLSLVTDGLANKQIARHLGISEKTVKAHLTRVFATIGVADRTQAAMWAVGRRALVP